MMKSDHVASLSPSYETVSTGADPLRTLDLRGLKCPLPALRTRQALRRARPGERLEVLSTDPLAGIDIPNVVREEGDRLEEQPLVIGAVHRFVIRRLAVSAPGEGPFS